MPRFSSITTNPISSGPVRGPFLLENSMPKWRNEYRRCENCRGEYRPQREAQSYCSPDCRWEAAYGRERFKAGTEGRRKRRLEASERRPIEASETFPGRVVAGSFRKRGFYLIKSVACTGGNTPALVQDRRWPHLYRIHWPDGVISTPANLPRCNDAIRNWIATSLKQAA
jgi:hypothetical protein